MQNHACDSFRQEDPDAEKKELSAREISEDANAASQMHLLRCELEQERMAKEAAEKELATLRSSLAHVFGTRVVKLERKLVSRSRGLGTDIEIDSAGNYTLRSLIAGGAASVSGKIFEGDRLLSVNGVPVKGLLPTAVSKMIQCAENSEVVLTLETGAFSIDSLRWLVDRSLQKQEQRFDEHNIERNCSSSENMSTDAFTAALVSIPSCDWCRTWPAERTILLRMTSKRVKEAVDKLRPPAVVRVRTKFVTDTRNGSSTYTKMEYILTQLARLSACFSITILDLSPCDISVPEGSFIHPQFREEHASIQSFMHEQLPSVLSQCPLMLRHLDLSNNDIGSAGAGSLVGVLAQCQALSHFNMSNNRIGDAGVESFAGVLGQCPVLAHLDLSLNRFGSEGAGRLAGVLGQCRLLTLLNLRGNRIGEDGAGKLAGVLGQCTVLTHLDLTETGIGPAGAEKLAGVLGQCTALAHLDLTQNGIGPAGAEKLAGVLPQLPELRGLYLGNNGLEDAGHSGVRKIAEVLPYCRALCRLNLKNTGISSPGTAMKLAEVLVQCKTLSYLDLSHNFQLISEGFSEILGQCRALSYLNLGYCKTGDEGVRRLAQGQGLCKTLTYLDLEYTTKDSPDYAGYHGARGPLSTLPGERLAELLGRCPSLSTVVLAGNFIEDQGAGMIAEVLPRCTALSHLDLRSNHIGNDGAGLIAGVLGQCTALSHLDISHNEIEDEGAGMLAEVLRQCTSLTHLNLKRNAIRDKGAGMLAKVLGQCPALVHLNLEGNNIRDEGAVSFAEAVRERPTRTELCLGANRIGADGAEVLTLTYRLYTTLSYLSI